MITRAKIERFIKIRNKSAHSNNLQFAFDCNSAGFSPDELPKPDKIDGGWRWSFDFGVMIEEHGMMRLEEI